MFTTAIEKLIFNLSLYLQLKFVKKKNKFLYMAFLKTKSTLVQSHFHNSLCFLELFGDSENVGKFSFILFI